MTSRVKYEVTLKLDQTERRINLALTFLHISTAILYRIEQRASRESCFHYNSPVHVVLVSLLVNQLLGLYLIFFGRPKKNLFSLREFLVSLWFFWSTKFLFGIPKFLFSIPKNQSLTKKNSETDQKFPETEQIFFGRPKKVRDRPDNWSTKRLTKTTWTGL